MLSEFSAKKGEMTAWSQCKILNFDDPQVPRFGTQESELYIDHLESCSTTLTLEGSNFSPVLASLYNGLVAQHKRFLMQDQKSLVLQILTNQRVFTIVLSASIH